MIEATNQHRVKNYFKKIKGFVWNFPFFLYVIKCLFGTVLCYAVYTFMPQAHLSAALMACLLVLAPDEKDSLKLALVRIRANLVGGIFAVICIYLPFSTIGCLCLCVPLIIIACYIQDFGETTRWALSTFAVVVLQVRGGKDGDVELGLYWLVAVVIGCAIALLMTVMFHFFVKYFNGSDADVESTNNILKAVPDAPVVPQVATPETPVVQATQPVQPVVVPDNNGIANEAPEVSQPIVPIDNGIENEIQVSEPPSSPPPATT